MGTDDETPRSFRVWIITIFIDLAASALLALILRAFNNWSDAIESALVALLVWLVIDVAKDVLRRRRQK
jgi:hypothetical protein